jgi:ribosomal-protein-alanine N-acetyltransferase
MATPLIARPATLARGSSADLDELMPVMESAFGDRFGEAWTRSQCAGILPMAGVTLTIARSEPDCELAGFSLARTIAGEAELLLIAVAPDRHRQGIGRQLLENFVEQARDAGVERVHLEVRAGNDAERLYRAAGFEPVGRRRNYYRGSDGSRFDALTFAQRI